MKITTREKILQTALKLFSEKGYIGATTKEISKKAGIAEVTLFRHFPSKEKLFEEVINKDSFLPVLKGLMLEIEGMPYEDALIRIAGRFLEILDLRKDLIKIMQSEFRRYPEKIHEIYHAFLDEIFRTLAAYFNEMQSRGTLIKFNTESGARAFLGMFFSFFNAKELMMRDKYREIDTGATIREYVKIFTRGTLK